MTTLTKEKAMELIEKFNAKKSKLNFYNELAKMDNKTDNENGINEQCHSKIIALLLNAGNKGKNSMEYAFLKNFINKLENFPIDNISRFMNLLSSDLIVKTEYNNIDIFMYSKNADFVCVIENKLDGELRNKQLEKYVNFINTTQEYKECKYKKFVYLRKYLDTIRTKDRQQIEANKYQGMEYSDISDMIDNDVLKSAPDNRMCFNILQYKEFLDLYWYDTIDGIWIEKAKEVINNSHV